MVFRRIWAPRPLLAALALAVTPYAPAAIEETTALEVLGQEVLVADRQEEEALAVEVADVGDERASTSYENKMGL